MPAETAILQDPYADVLPDPDRLRERIRAHNSAATELRRLLRLTLRLLRRQQTEATAGGQPNAA